MKFRSAGEPIAKKQLETLKKEMSAAELDLFDEIQQSKRNAWRVTAGSFVLALACLGLMGFVIFQYAQPVPASLLAYNSKDPMSIQSVTLSADAKTYGELTDDYWVGQFIIARESYDYPMMQRYYDTVGLIATGDVATGYSTWFGNGDKAIDKQWGNSKTITTEVISVLRDERSQSATIRFKTVERNARRGMDDPPQYWIATVGYRYVKTPMKPGQRMLNPLGFKVVSYTKRAEAANNVVGG